MKGNEIRSKFLEYFQKHGHFLVESSSLVPQNDPTLLFTNAGMVQFKTVFMGEDQREYTTAVTSQRCVRAGGKHNDLENVGYTARHHTFFEMLGNFSFGQYFKKEAIQFAWEFLTIELGLPPEKLWVTIFQDDDEAYRLWDAVESLPKGRIVRMGEKDNFWAMGDTGPCGPCSEIHIDQGTEAGCGKPECALGCDCDRFLELWNLVFMQFNRAEDGTMTPLPKPSIDTGMGLERVAAVLQNKRNNYDSDLFVPIIECLERLSNKRYGLENSVNIAMRVIADHARATAFLIADGVLPSNEGRGYVLRRIMRRAVRYGKNIGLERPFMTAAALSVIEAMAHAYPHLRNAETLLIKVVNHEEARFRETLEHGLQLLDEKVALMRANSEQIIAGDFIFKLYDTYGFPFDIVRDIALEHGMAIDEQGFHRAMEDQKEKSRMSRKGEGVRLKDEGVKELAAKKLTAEFTGYQNLEEETVVQGLLDSQGKTVEHIGVGETGRVFVPTTPFYAESGGQLGDTGEILWKEGRAVVLGTTKEGDGLILHNIRISAGVLQSGQPVTMRVDTSKRMATASHHSATHLLQAALVSVLGDHVKQAGSLVGPDRLRFDFTHFSPLSAEQAEAVEFFVNSRILANMQVQTRIIAKEEAIAEGATALFGEKYDDFVRVVEIGTCSKELCGGTHVQASGQIGVFKILSEGGIAAGVRRIEALTGEAALRHIQQICRREQQLGVLLNAKEDGVVKKIESILAEQKVLEKRVAELSAKLAGSDFDNIMNSAVDIDGIKILSSLIPLDSPQTLRTVGDKVRDSLGSGIAVLGGAVNDKAALLAIVTQDLTSKVKAGALVNLVAQVVGGKGGGRPDMAQAGGTMPDKLPEAIAQVPDFVKTLLRGA